MRNLFLTAFMVVATGCGGETLPLAAGLPTYNIDASRITVSGASSGAMMATQMHIAHSKIVGGAALIAGGPYYCAEGSLKKGLGPCMQGGGLNVPGLLAYTRDAASRGAVDALGNLADDAVWIFHGSRDEVIHPDLAAGAIEFYESLGVGDIRSVTDVPVAHGVPTLATGAPCDEMASPFLNACDYDGAGQLLEALYGELQPRGDGSGVMLTVAQPGADDASMLADTYLYVPDSCANGEACGVHVAFHGCQQSSAFVGAAFVSAAGYNAWADTNRLIVLYPQVDSSKIAPMNPMGCWDWWGYTDEHYATKQGAQITVVKAMLDQLAGKTL